MNASPATNKTTYPYFTPDQVAQHNSPDDCWVSWLGCVYNLTDMTVKHNANAGQDISHWFDKKTGNLKTHINPMTNCSGPAIPYGRFLNIPPPLPRIDWKAEDGSKPWWIDQSRCLGYLSKKTRKIKLVNTLTGDQHVLEVCSEDTLSAIQDRYTALNAHAKGYMWKRHCSLLDMNLTLQENGIEDEDDTFDGLGMNNEAWLPVIHLYFSDDLTVA